MVLSWVSVAATRVTWLVVSTSIPSSLHQEVVRITSTKYCMLAPAPRLGGVPALAIVLHSERHLQLPPVVPVVQELLIIHIISTQYLHNIYRVSKKNGI